YAYRFSSLFVSPAVGFFAALFLACNPMWFGYMFINLKDIPFATTLFAAAYHCLKALHEPSNSVSTWLKIGLSVGLLATTKLVGILVLGVVCLVTLTVTVALPNANLWRVDNIFFGRLSKIAASSVAGCAIFLGLFWPQFYLYEPKWIFYIVLTFMNYDLW